MLLRAAEEGRFKIAEYMYAAHNDVSVNDGPHIRRWSHNKIKYNI